MIFEVSGIGIFRRSLMRLMVNGLNHSSRDAFKPRIPGSPVSSDAVKSGTSAAGAQGPVLPGL